MNTFTDLDFRVVRNDTVRSAMFADEILKSVGHLG